MEILDRFTIRTRLVLIMALLVGLIALIGGIGAMGMSDGFAELVARHIADRVLEEAHRIRYPEPAPDQVKLGRLGFDGFMALEIGAELRHLLGDQAYEMDAEMRGEKEPDDPTRATSLNPASSTPKG